MDINTSLDEAVNGAMREYLHDFFLAIVDGNTAYTNFLSQLSALSNTIQDNHTKLRVETISTVSQFASMIRKVATDMVELPSIVEKSLNENAADILKILNDKLGDLRITDIEDPKGSKGSSYIKPSYQWLLCNLHNPYPSKEVKKDISRQTNCAIKDIDAWFVDVRKRIGWNRLRKTRFSNKQERIVAAATHIFRPKPSSFSDDPNESLLSQMDPQDQYRAEFLAMAHTARSLYADKFPDLIPSLSWTQFLTYVSPDGIPDASPKANFKPSSAQSLMDNRYPYPTPEPSPRSHFTDQVITETPSTVDQNTRKRRPDDEDVDTEHLHNRSPKRFRCDSLESIDILSPTSLPSPCKTADDLSDETFENGSLFESTTEDAVAPEIQSVKRKRSLFDAEGIQPINEPNVSMKADIIASNPTGASEKSQLKRKRRLSHGEDQRTPKRPHTALARPRLQTVSDPFPMANLALQFPSTVLSQQVEQGGLEPVQDSPACFTKPTVEQLIPSTCLDPCPTDFFNYLINEHTTSTYLPEHSEQFSTFNNSVYLDTLPDLSSKILVSAVDFLDFEGFPSFQEQKLTPTQVTPMNDDLFHWLASIQSDNLSCPPNFLGSHALSNDHEVYPESLDAKRAKLQALKQQVFQLEGQLAGQLVA